MGVKNSDVGNHAIINGISLEGRVFRGAAEIRGVTGDLFGEKVEVMVQGVGVQHFRQHDISEVQLAKKTPPRAPREGSSACAFVALLIMSAVFAAYAGVHHLLV